MRSAGVRIAAALSLVGGLTLLSVSASAQQADSISIQWLSASGPVVGYDVYVEIDGGATNFYRSVSEPRAVVDGAPFQVGDALRFQVVAFAADGRRSLPSEYSEVIFFVALPTPTGVTAMDGSVLSPITIDWDPVEYVSDYVVYRSTAAGVSGVALGSVNMPFFEDRTAASDVDYYYSVVAVKGWQTSGFSAQVLARFGGRHPELVATPAALSYSFAPTEYTASQTVELTNVGDWGLTYAAWPGTRWLSVSPVGGTLDRETDTLTVTYSTGSLPAGQHRSFVWLYTYYQQPDGESAMLGPPLEIEVVVNIPIRNQAPVFETTTLAVEVAEGQVVSIPIRATDPDPGDLVSLGVGSMTPFMSFQNLGGGEGSLTIAPGYESAGMYALLLVAWDSGLPRQFGFADRMVTVKNTNRQPDAEPIPPTTIRTGVTTRLALTAFDPDLGDRLAIATSALPPFASFTDLGNGTGEFTFSPTSAHIGTYMIIAAIVDSGSPTQFKVMSFSITVAP